MIPKPSKGKRKTVSINGARTNGYPNTINHIPASHHTKKLIHKKFVFVKDKTLKLLDVIREYLTLLSKCLEVE